MNPPYRKHNTDMFINNNFIYYFRPNPVASLGTFVVSVKLSPPYKDSDRLKEVTVKALRGPANSGRCQKHGVLLQFLSISGIVLTRTCLFHECRLQKLAPPTQKWSVGAPGLRSVPNVVASWQPQRSRVALWK